MATDLDELMDLDPLSMTRDNITQLVGYFRERRMKMEAGEKPKRAKREEGPKIAISLESLGLKPKAEPIKKRF